MHKGDPGQRGKWRMRLELQDEGLVSKYFPMGEVPSPEHCKDTLTFLSQGFKVQVTGAGKELFTDDEDF